MPGSHFLVALASVARPFRSDDLDEVRAVMETYNGAHSRVTHGRGCLGFELASARAGGTVLAWNRAELAQTVRGVAPAACLHLALDQSVRYRFGRQELSAGPGAVAFFPSGTEYTRDTSAGATMVLQLHGPDLAAEIAARNPSCRATDILTPQLLALTPDQRNSLLDLAADLAGALDTALAVDSRAAVEARLLSQLVDAIVAHTAVGRVPPMSLRRLADLESWIDAHLAEPITLGRLCALAGVGERALQLGFQSRRGTSPMRFVAERRMAAVHGQLIGARPGDDVTSLAIGMGFSHLGRFSTLYRQLFGESPSQTLRRAIGPDGHPRPWQVAASAYRAAPQRSLAGRQL